MKKKTLHKLGILFPSIGAIFALIGQEYTTAFWAFLVALAEYRLLQKQKRVEKLSTISANFEDFLEKAEVKEIKEFFKTLDSSDEWSKVE